MRPDGLGGWKLAMVLATLVAAGLARAEPLRLRVGVPEGMPGYALRDGQLLIDAESKRRLYQCVEKALGARFVWEALPARRVVQGVIEGPLDLAFAMGFNEERAARMLQSEPAWENPDVWVSLKPIDPQDKRLRLAARLGSPQHDDHQALGYARVAGVYTYEEMARMLSQDMVDAVVLPRSLYEDMKSTWPAGHRVLEGKARNSGFYLPKADPRQLAVPLNQAIRRCRTAAG